MTNEETRNQILEEGKALKDKCSENNINCAVFMEWPEGDTTQSVVRLSHHCLYSVGGFISPVLDSVLEAYRKSQIETEGVGDLDSIPLLTLSELKDN